MNFTQITENFEIFSLCASEGNNSYLVAPSRNTKPIELTVAACNNESIFRKELAEKNLGMLDMTVAIKGTKFDSVNITVMQ